jgi:rubrerythrin
MGTDILDIIRRAYQIEVDGYTFYSMAAEHTDKPAVQALFAQLAKDERQHQEYLREVAGNYRDKGGAVFEIPVQAPDLSAFADPVFTEELRRQVGGAAFEAGVLSIGMTVESNAIGHYSDAAKEASDDRARAFYQFLAVWERQHLVALQNAYKAIRSDFWHKSGL